MLKVGDEIRILIDRPQCAPLGTGDIVWIRSLTNDKKTIYVTGGWGLSIDPDTHYKRGLGVAFELVKPEGLTSPAAQSLKELWLVQPSKLTLPTDSTERKNYPLFAGMLRYFPAALAGVANISKLGNDKHNPGEELHHARGKSMDHGDCVIRHLMDIEDLLAAQKRGESVTNQQVLTEVNQMAWRALAFAQEIHEKFGAPMAPGAKK